MHQSLKTVKSVAIIRGVDSARAAEVTGVFVRSGFNCVEVPLNSPTPLLSIKNMAQAFGDRVLIGAGTVLSEQDVQDVAEAGGKIIVSPNTNPAVIAETKRLGLISLPGVITPTDCFTALDAGADGLKLFPASNIGIEGMQAYLAVLPKLTRVYAVGGVTIENVGQWLAAGAAGFGVATNVFTPGMGLEQIEQLATPFTSH